MHFSVAWLIISLNLLFGITHVAAFRFEPRRSNITNFLGFGNIESRFREILKGDEIVTEFENLRGLYLMQREWTFALYNTEKAFQFNLKNGKIQREIPTDSPFPCDLNFARSATPPTTVHKLRPGDIDIIMALGDSLSAGTNLMTESFTQILYENRGLAFSGGGVGNWRQFLTLPNILKVFNPNLYGFSIADGLANHRTSRFNVAEPTAMSQDLIFQTHVLIQRLRQDPNVDMKNHWKLLTLFIGNVDFCGDYCVYNDIRIPLRNHERDLRESLTLLRDNVPRLFVNLMPAPNSIPTMNKMKVPMSCYTIHRVFCGCIVNTTNNDADRQNYASKIQVWQNLDAYIAELPEFNTDDFTVITQPFLNNLQAPLLPNGEIDQRYFGTDCFHLSQLGHASLANSLWNNMMQPVGAKQSSFDPPFKHFECPNMERPYLATRENSFRIGI